MGDESLTEGEIAFAQMRGWVIGRLAQTHEEIKKEFWQTVRVMWPSHAERLHLIIKDGDFELTMDDPPKESEIMATFNHNAAKLIAKSGLTGKAKIVWNEDEPPLVHGEPKKREMMTHEEMCETLNLDKGISRPIQR